MNLEQLKTQVIEPVLHHLDLHSKAAVNLLLGVCAVESDSGEYLVQLNSGPAKGIFQMEPATRKDIDNNFLKYRPVLRGLVRDYAVSGLNLDDQLVFNLAYAVAMARVHFYRVPDALPDHDDLIGLAGYWKKHYNTVLGAGTVDHFIDKFPAKVAYV